MTSHRSYRWPFEMTTSIPPKSVCGIGQSHPPISTTTAPDESHDTNLPNSGCKYSSMTYASPHLQPVGTSITAAFQLIANVWHHHLSGKYHTIFSSSATIVSSSQLLLVFIGESPVTARRFSIFIDSFWSNCLNFTSFRVLWLRISFTCDIAIINILLCWPC